MPLMFFLVQSLISSNRIVQVRSEICIPQVWQTCILGTVDFLRLLISQEAALAKAAGNVMPVGWYPHVRSKLCVYSCFASLIAVSMCSLPHLFFFFLFNWDVCRQLDRWLLCFCVCSPVAAEMQSLLVVCCVGNPSHSRYAFLGFIEIWPSS